LVTLIVGGACDVSVEDMRKWKDLKDGERRIAAFVSDSGRSMPQRVTAAMVLVEIDQSFILADALKQSEAKDRQQIVSGMLPKLLEMLKGKPKDQPRAKDALYLVGGYLDVEDRTKAARAVATWATEDFAGRFASGQTTLAQVLPELGTASVPGLLRQLETGEAIPEVVTILSAFESQPVHDQAVATLVDLIRKEGSQAPKEAWNSLTKFTTPELTPFLLEKIADKSLELGLRDRFLAHVQKCGGPQTVPGLAKLLEVHDVRWVAAQDLADYADVDGLEKVLASLPATDAYEETELYDEVHFFCSRRLPLLKAGKARVEKVLIAALSPKRVLSSVVAAHCLELYGTKEAAGPLKALLKAKQPVTGWKDGETKLSAVAKAAVEAIDKRDG